MDAEKINSRRSIRTFAQDLATAREKRGQSKTEGSSLDSSKKSATSSTAVKENFQAQAPQKTSPTQPKTTKKETPDSTIISPALKKTPVFESLEAEINDFTQKQAATKASKKPALSVPKTSVKTKSKQKSTRPNIGYDSTIITDNRHKRFSLFGAIKNSLHNWFKNFSTKKRKKAPVYTVPDTQRRKGVIQKATSRSGSIFTADSTELKAQIKRRQQLAAKKEGEKQEEKELSWSPYTNSGFALLESAEKQEETVATNPYNVSVKYKKLSQPTDTSLEKEPDLPPAAPEPIIEATATVPKESQSETNDNVIDTRWDTASTDQPEQTSKPEQLRASVPIEKEPETPSEPIPVPETEEQKPEPITVSTPEPIEKEPETPSEPIPVPVPETEEQKPEPIPVTSTSTKKPSRVDIQAFNTNTLALGTVATLVTLVVVFFATREFVDYLAATEPVVLTDSTSYLLSATANPVVVTKMETKNDIPLQAGRLMEVDYIDTQLLNPEGYQVPPITIVNALGFQMSPSFVQSLTDIRFAQKNQSKPIIIFKFTDPETVLGGFLAWEDVMASDLKELYLITEPNKSSFIDKVIIGKDVRVLQSVNGETLAVYGIVSDDTALITGSIDTFIQVVTTSFNQ